MCVVRKWRRTVFVICIIYSLAKTIVFTFARSFRLSCETNMIEWINEIEWLSLCIYSLYISRNWILYDNLSLSLSLSYSYSPWKIKWTSLLEETEKRISRFRLSIQFSNELMMHWFLFCLSVSVCLSLYYLSICLSLSLTLTHLERSSEQACWKKRKKEFGLSI